jgi:glycosyltransferase involved in cell wall biosynthesis
MDKPKKVLLMRGYFPPESAASNQMCLDLIKRLGERGMEVTVACPIPTRGVSDEIRREYKNKKKEELFPNVTIKRYWLPKEKSNSLLRAARYLMQNVYQFFYGLCMQYDVLFLYSTPPTNGMIGGMLAEVKKKRFYYYLHDIFPDSLVQTGLTQTGSLIWKIGRKIENYSYKHASKVITISESMKDNIIEKGVPCEKIAIVPNWVNVEQVHHIERDKNTLIKEFHIDPEKFIVTYAGNIGESQSVNTLIEAAKLLRTEEDVLFVVIGDGTEKEKCMSIASELNNVMFIPMQSPSRISEVYSLGNVSTVLCKKGVGAAGMPSKTGSIFATSTMIIAAFDKGSDLQRIIDQNKLGICVDPEKPESLAEAIMWAKSNTECVKQRGEKGNNYLTNHMTDEICTDKLWSIICS